MKENIAIVGSGFLGMTLAMRLADAGANVTLFESAPEIGGLASVWEINDIIWDKHYHVVLASDRNTRNVFEEIGLADEFRWVETKTGFYTDGELLSMSNTMEFLTFKPLDIISKLRLGATIFYASKVKDWRRLEQLDVEKWLTRWSGKKTFEKMWKPLLKAKLGDAYKQTAASFIWATIQRMYSARNSGMKKEMFGYIRGGYGKVLERFGETLVEKGVEIRLNARVKEIKNLENGKIRVSMADTRRHKDTKPQIVTQRTKYAQFQAAAAVAPGFSGAFLSEPQLAKESVVDFPRSKANEIFDKVILTCPSNVAAKMMPQLTDTEKQDLNAIQYQGIVCASVMLRCSLSNYYVTNITDETPFTGVIEMSAIVDKREFNGNALVYLPRYIAPDDDLFDKTDDEIQEIYLRGLERMYPHFRRADVVAFKISKVRQVFPVPVVNYSQGLSDMKTSVDGVYVVNSSHIVNGTLNINETVGLAERFFADFQRRTRIARMKRLGSVSLDLDNQWSYMKTNGDAGWEDFPSYLDLAVPRILAFLKERDLKITFFVIGQDAALEKNRDAIASIAEAGHEIGNHSFNHEPWLHLYSKAELVSEFERTENALESITGKRPVGFRGPGYSLSPAVLETLGERGYEYDCSLLPTYIAPLARAFFFLNSSKMSDEEKAKRKKLFGKFSDGFQSLKPHFIEAAGKQMVEIPVTTFPLVKTPIHASYLLYLSTFSAAAAKAYWRSAVAACSMTGVEPSFLLHPLDFLGGEDVPAMKFFPGMANTSQRKIDFLGETIAALTNKFDVVSMREHADHFRQQSSVGSVSTAATLT